MRKIILGPPGSGKGTAALKLSPKYELPHISTGDLFRENIKSQTSIGLKAKEYMNKGELVPDEIVIEMLKQRISQPDCEKGFILDGFPRTIEQAKKLSELTNIDLVINMDIAEEIVIGRLSSRLSCPNCNAIYNSKHLPPKQQGICDNCNSEIIQRDDDKPETIKNRLEIYKKSTQPLVDFYQSQGILRNLFLDNIDQTPDETFNQVIDLVEDFIKEMKTSSVV